MPALLVIIERETSLSIHFLKNYGRSLQGDLCMKRNISIALSLLLVVVGLVGAWKALSGLAVSNPAPARALPQYLPPATMFGLTASWATISSDYSYENNLINGSVAVADTDLMLPYGSQEIVSLPKPLFGGTYIYRHIITGYVPGSGYYETWETPNGGYFAFLHLSRTYVGPVYSAPPLPAQVYGLNGDHTGIAVALATSRSSKATLFRAPSGGIVGVSGWPTDAGYGNGTAGPSNAHLCVVYDALSLQWFYYLATHHPSVFPYKKWKSYTTRHHKKYISPYTGRKLSSVALYWWHKNKYATCGSVVGRRMWYNNYTKERFQTCSIFYWPKYNTYKIVKEHKIV